MIVTRITIEFDKLVGPNEIEWITQMAADAALVVGAQTVTTAESVEIEELLNADENES